MANDPYKRALSQNLKSIRKGKGLSTVQLAQLLGVSQAKVSYIEHCKGVLSARDIAVLSKKLNIPVTEFFRGLNDDDSSQKKDLAGNLARFGAVLLAKSSGLTLDESPFEEVFTHSLGFIEDDRLHKGLCAALISQAAQAEINIDRIFALIGNNPFLIKKASDQVLLCLAVISILKAHYKKVPARAKVQLQKIADISHELLGKPPSPAKKILPNADISDIADFVEECLNANG